MFKRALTAVILLILAAPAFAAEPNPKTIAPLVDEACVIVAHVDMTKVTVDPIFDEAIRFVDALWGGEKQSSTNKQLLAMRTQVNVARVAADQFLKMSTEGLKINEVYVIYSLQDILPEPAVIFAVPIREGLDLKKVTDFAAAFNPGKPERVGDFLVLVLGDIRTSEPGINRLKAVRPDARPELAEAFAAVGPAPIRLTLTFPKYAKEVFEDVFPRLPEKVGGQSTGELIGATRWIALGIDPEKVALKAIVQCDSPEAAKKMRDVVERGIQSLRTVEPEVAKRLPKMQIDRFLAEHGPQVEKSRVVWTLAAGEPGGKALRSLLLKLVPSPAEPAAPSVAAPKKSGRLVPPKIDRQEAADLAMKQYDTDKDGEIAGKELDGAPALKSAIKNLDTDKDGAVSHDEIVGRIQAWQDSRVGRMAIQCTVAYRGQPLPDATVVFEPEEFLGAAMQSGEGVTDANGTAVMSIPDIVPPGLAPGLYRVKITSKKVKLPEKYNKKTTLGQEISNDAAGMETGLIFWLD